MSRCYFKGMFNGIPVIVVAKILGHSKPSTTLDIYGHIIPVMQEEAAKIMGELITPLRVDLQDEVQPETLEIKSNCTHTRTTAHISNEPAPRTGS